MQYSPRRVIRTKIGKSFNRKFFLTPEDYQKKHIRREGPDPIPKYSDNPMRTVCSTIISFILRIGLLCLLVAFTRNALDGVRVRHSTLLLLMTQWRCIEEEGGNRSNAAYTLQSYVFNDCLCCPIEAAPNSAYYCLMAKLSCDEKNCIDCILPILNTTPAFVSLSLCPCRCLTRLQTRRSIAF